MTATTSSHSAPAPAAAPRHARDARETRMILSFTTASALAAAAWLLLWVVPIPVGRSGFDVGSCGSVASPVLGPCRDVLEQQAMWAGFALGLAGFWGIMAFVYAKTRGPLRDGVQAVHWFLAALVGVMLMCAWLAVTLGTIDHVFVGR